MSWHLPCNLVSVETLGTAGGVKSGKGTHLGNELGEPFQVDFVDLFFSKGKVNGG